MPDAARAALQRLLDGNARYASGEVHRPNQTDERRAEVANGQAPFAIVVGCADSRVPAEIVFDCGLGDLFVVRTAGQVLDRAVVGTVQYGVAVLGIPLVVVLAHERCGAVTAAVNAIEGGGQPAGDIGDGIGDGIAYLVEQAMPAVLAVAGLPGDHLDNAVRENAVRVAAQLRDVSGAELVAAARYDLVTGLVAILDGSPART